MVVRVKGLKFFLKIALTILILQILILSPFINSISFNQQNINSDETNDTLSKLIEDKIREKEESLSIAEDIDLNNIDTPLVQLPEKAEAKISEYNGLPSMSGNTVINQLVIDNNSHFLQTAQTNSWQGTGNNKYDPIIIENHNFTGSGLNSLYLHNTTLHFVIQNCFFSNGQNLTLFRNTSNGILKGNTFEGATKFGLFLDKDSQNHTIVYNNFLNNQSGGINANDNNTLRTYANKYYYNFWDNHNSTNEDPNVYGVSDDSYSINGSTSESDGTPRIYKQYWNHKRIYMRNNNLTDLAREEGSWGNGTKENPIVISNLNITFKINQAEPGIMVYGTTDYIQIKNCYIANNNNAGIELFDYISNTSVVNVTIINCSIGLLVSYSASFNNFTNILIKNSTEEGIELKWDTWNLSFSKVDIINSGFNGMKISSSENLTISDCKIENSGTNGMYGWGVKTSRIDNCVLKNSTISGIALENSQKITIELTNITDADQGMYFTGLSNSTFNQIEIFNCTGAGIDFWSSLTSIDNNLFNEVIITNSSSGVILLATSSYPIYNNTFHKSEINSNGTGMDFNSQDRLFVDKTRNNTVINCTITSDNGIAINIDLGVNNTIKRNNIRDSNVGVNLTSQSIDNTVIENYFTNNINTNAYDNGTNNKWDNGTHGNYWDDYSGVDLVPPIGIGDSPYLISGPVGSFDNYPLIMNIITLYIGLLNPFNGSVIRSSVNITFDINATAFYYNWDNNANSTQAIESPTMITTPITDGLHSLEIYINNDSAQWIYLYLEFIIDNTDPIIDSYDLTNDTEVGTDTWIPFLVNDTNYEGFWYSWNGSAPVYTIMPGAWAPDAPGIWELEVFANDTAGNTAVQAVILNVLQAADLDLLYPNGGETIFGYCYIYWNTSLEININVSYSPDVGNTWIQIATSVEDSFYIWNTRTVNDGTNYLVRIVSTTVGIPGSDMSFSVFSIDNSGLRNDTEYYSLPEITVNITLSSPTSITIKLLLNVSINMVPGNDFFTPGLYIEVILENKSALEQLAISFSYADIETDLINAGLSVDDDLKVYFYNEDSSKWEEADKTEYDVTRKLVIGYFNHTTVIGVLGKSESTPSLGAGDIPWLLLIAGVAFLAALGGVGLIIQSQKKKF